MMICTSNYSPLYTVQKVLWLILASFVVFVQVRAECSAQRAYIIFRTLGLRHLCVTDSSNRFGFKSLSETSPQFCVVPILRMFIINRNSHQNNVSCAKLFLEDAYWIAFIFVLFSVMGMTIWKDSQFSGINSMHLHTLLWWFLRRSLSCGFQCFRRQSTQISIPNMCKLPCDVS